MSTLSTEEDYDYSDLTNSYMGIFNTKAFERFLSTTQTGYAHTSSGIDLNLLLKTLITSLCICTIQLTVFCFFRSTLKIVYQPRCFCVPVNERMDPLPRGFLSWVLPTMKSNMHFYLSMGLDTYFFVRFINVLLLYFIFIGTSNMIILLPINWTGSDQFYQAPGLDRLSLSNIASSKVSRLNSHFLMGLVTIGTLHCLIIYELSSFVSIRQSYLLSPNHRESAQGKMLLISNCPHQLLEEEVLSSVFGFIPGGIKKVWFVHDFKDISREVQKARSALDTLEKAQILYLKKSYRCQFPRKKWLRNYFSDKIEDITDHLSEDEYHHSLEPQFYPAISMTIFFPIINRSVELKLPGFLRFFAFQDKISMTTWSAKQLDISLKAIDAQKQLMNEGRLTKHTKLFVQFNTQEGAYIAHQCLLSRNQGDLDSSLVEVHAGDIKWNNLSRNNSYTSLVEKYIVNLAFICIIILYVVPVSFIGLFSQIPFLVQLMPFLAWIYKFPEEVRETISSFLPSILLTILTEIVMVTFRYLTKFKGILSGAELELDLQRWHFSFLFVQQFLVVTISSSITVIFKQILDQPTSIPILLATNLPKGANFFFQFFALKAFAFCGANFMRAESLIFHYLTSKLRDITPRQKFHSLTGLPKIKWGTVYPVFSVYACIGITYSIISPLISIFIIFILMLILLYYKYALKYIYSHINESETQGRLYPIALLHLYTGMYCLECCLIGIFFLSKDEDGNSPMKVHGWIMILVLLITIFGHQTIFNRFVKHFSYLPILSDFKNKEINTTEKNNSNCVVGEVANFKSTDGDDHELLYLHPAFKFEDPKLWLPSDPLGICLNLIQHIEHLVPGLQGGTTKGASVIFDNTYRKVKIRVTEAPPDYK
ncbi:predicted protein [Scheffersomyces stipitis CBS 6054]|uniref:Uncharacterized protein n=1 Tax=Scheffersomyces stipitis (strain ATCC 58785 / CBS 6054 / NBRC 10063 / NRRL Y-11545) TaxID=322104 RepID=A3LTM5_PICST|nr:predicted protein [Scheffersomyces stipitis CBS 6054]ABN66090.2 predicted protein [Scheffersomyces stipitis CBS 6054]